VGLEAKRRTSSRTAVLPLSVPCRDRAAFHTADVFRCRQPHPEPFQQTATKERRSPQQAAKYF
jgi:hypothetical protein